MTSEILTASETASLKVVETCIEENCIEQPSLPTLPNEPGSRVLGKHVPVHDLVFNEAKRIVHNTRHTKYQHKQVIDEATGTYEIDCSEYVSYALSRVARRHLDMIPRESFWPVPRAFKFYEYFASLSTNATHAWRQVERLEDAHRGDMIAWQLSGEIRENHDTGHVIILAGTPTFISEDLLAVKAYDSAALAHYDDTRETIDGVFQDGVGGGTFHLRVDEAGKPIAFQFGPGDRFHKKPIAIGRALPV